MRALLSTSFTFKWYICVLLCRNVCIFSTLFNSCESRQKQTKETKIMSKRVNNTEVIMMHLFFSKSSEETLLSFSSLQVAWGSSFQTLPACYSSTLLLVLGFHPWASSVAFSSGMEARLRFSDCPLHLAAKQDGFSFSVHLLPTYFNKSPAKWWTASEIQVMNMPPLWSAEFIFEGAKRACTQPQISFSTCIPNIAVAASY